MGISQRVYNVELLKRRGVKDTRQFATDCFDAPAAADIVLVGKGERHRERLVELDGVPVLTVELARDGEIVVRNIHPYADRDEAERELTARVRRMLDGTTARVGTYRLEPQWDRTAVAGLRLVEGD